MAGMEHPGLKQQQPGLEQPGQSSQVWSSQAQNSSSWAQSISSQAQSIQARSKQAQSSSSWAWSNQARSIQAWSSSSQARSSQAQSSSSQAQSSSSSQARSVVGSNPGFRVWREKEWCGQFGCQSVVSVITMDSERLLCSFTQKDRELPRRQQSGRGELKVTQGTGVPTWSHVRKLKTGVEATSLHVHAGAGICWLPVFCKVLCSKSKDSE
uniref:Uncharacterized protein n=1 Tax=Pipistrellus kuhlii TaxID=59472 RepID=A0A7J7QX75_PIPKU|nr:hypothetical protein mPipKuh1_008221 [Pipistrellus kuhlii]